MARRRDKVQETVDSVVTEARITLDTTLFCEDVFALSFEVVDDFLEAAYASVISETATSCGAD